MTKDQNAAVAELAAKLELVLREASDVASLVTGQATVIAAAVALLRDEHGVGAAELRERAIALAEAAGGDLAASVPRIYEILPDEGAPVLRPN